MRFYSIYWPDDSLYKYNLRIQVSHGISLNRLGMVRLLFDERERQVWHVWERLTKKRYWRPCLENAAFRIILRSFWERSRTKRRGGPVESRCLANDSGNLAVVGYGGVFLGGRLEPNAVFRALNLGFGRMPWATGHVGLSRAKYQIIYSRFIFQKSKNRIRFGTTRSTPI